MDGMYYQQARSDFVGFILDNVESMEGGRALDVGCAAGLVGEALGEAGWRVWGVEPNAAIAAEAASRLEHVVVGEFPSSAEVSEGAPYDLVIFADCLEHMVDPWAALRSARELLSPTGTLAVSVPNVSNWSIVRSLVRGEWPYKDAGLLDRSHLRFFTPSSLRSALVEAGFTPYAARASAAQASLRQLPLKWVLALLAPHMWVFQQYTASRRDSTHTKAG